MTIAIALIVVVVLLVVLILGAMHFSHGIGSVSLKASMLRLVTFEFTVDRVPDKPKKHKQVRGPT